MGLAIQEGVRQQQLEQQRRIDEEAWNRQREHEIRQIRRVQTALRTMGYYTMRVDGDAGPGTQRALQQYFSAFRMQPKQLLENDILLMERRADAGFRNASEEQSARNGGFETRFDMEAAARAGFRDARSLAEARRIGARDAAELDAFRRAGFATMADFRQAKAAGFEDRSTWAAARRAGFDRHDEWEEFRSSGLPDRTAFLRAREQIAMRAEAAKACDDAIRSQDWLAAADACRLAATTAPDDPDMLRALRTAARSLEDVVEAARTAHTEATDVLAAMRADGSEDATAQARRVAQMERVLEAEETYRESAGARAAANCTIFTVAERWREAAEACEIALDRLPDDEKLAATLAAAKSMVEAEERALREERERIAREAVAREARELLETVDAFAADGGVFRDGLAVATALIDIRSALEKETSDGLEKARADLDAALAEEVGFARWVAAAEQAALEAEAAAYAEARRNAERLEAFVADWVSRNVTARQVPDILAIGRALDAAIESDDPDRIVAAQREATDRIRGLGLASAADAFRLRRGDEAERLAEAERTTRADEELRRLTDERARAEAADLVALVERFTGEERGAFGDALGVARAVVGLQNALADTDEERVVQAQTLLAERLAAEEPFTRFAERARQAARFAQADAFVAARENAVRLEAFVRQRVARDVLAAFVPDLLTMQETLEAALGGTDPDAVLAAQRDATERLAVIGLAEDAARFVLEPAVAAAALEADDARVEADAAALTRAEERAMALIETLDAFRTTGERFTDGLGVARALGAMRVSRERRDASDIGAAMAELERVLSGDLKFSQFAERRAAAMAAGASDARASAAEIATALDAFVRDLLSADPLRPHADVLIALQERLEGAIASKDGGTLALAIERSRGALGQIGLLEDADTFVARLQDDPSAAVETADNGLALTALNSALLEGDGRDILVLRNASGTAPHVRANLLGELVFDDGIARACWHHTPPEHAFGVRLARAGVLERGVDLVGEARCASGSGEAIDLVFLERGAFLAEPLAYARPFVEAFVAGDFEVLDVIAWSDVGARTAADAELAQAISDETRADARTGIGFAVFAAEERASTCLVEREPARAADARERERERHDALVAARAADLALYVDAPVQRIVADPEAVFARVQRRECAVVVARAEDMGVLLDALLRDDIDHRVLPLWLSSEEVADIETDVAARRAERLRAWGEARQSLEAEGDLDRAKRERDERSRLAVQERMRQENSQAARAALNDLAERVGMSLEGKVESEIADGFPMFTAWIESLPADFWEIIGHDSRLLDYGFASWDGRRIEAVSVLVTVETRNAELGRYETICVVLGWLIDREFGRRRDPFETSCEADAGSAWPQFESLWIAQAQED